MSSQQTQKLNNPEQSPSFDDVSKFFSLPLSEAADILGISTTMLKKICNDNGLERWPQRKYLAGKNIEDIKKEASRERNKTQRNSAAASSGPTSKVRDKTPVSSQEMSRSNSSGITAAQQPGESRSIVSWQALDSLSPSVAMIETSTCLDEFKYGFPSNGLSVALNRWWGGGDPTDHGDSSSFDVKDGQRNGDADKPRSDHSENGCVSNPVTETGGDPYAKDTSNSLSDVRKRAVDEGREALKLGVWKDFGVENLGKRKKQLLSRIFNKRINS